MKKRLAYCISGQLRSLDLCWQNTMEYVINPLSSQYDIDFFVYSKFDFDSKKIGVFHKTIEHKIKKIVFVADGKFDPEILKILEEIPKGGLNRLPNGQQLLYEVQMIDKVIELKRQYEEENSFKYDLVIRHRPDITFFDEFQLPKEIKDNLYLLNHDFHGGLNARFMMGRSHIMDKIGTFISSLPNFIHKVKYFAGEPFFRDFIVHLGLGINLLDYKCYLVRNSDNWIPENERNKVSCEQVVKCRADELEKIDY